MDTGGSTVASYLDWLQRFSGYYGPSSWYRETALDVHFRSEAVMSLQESLSRGWLKRPPHSYI